MPKRFAATEGAIEKGLENTTPASGAKLAHEWASALEDSDAAGAKGVHGDLVKLAAELEKDSPNQATVTKLLGKLGPATVKLADKCQDEKVGEKVRHLGEALQSSGTDDD